MTKAEIVAEIASKTGIEKGAVQNVVENFMEVVKNAMAKGENVYLRGFGSFIIKTRAVDSQAQKTLEKGQTQEEISSS